MPLVSRPALACLFALTLSVTALPAARAQLASQVPCLFRAFDGTTDVTATTRVRVYAAGKREGSGLAVEPGRAVSLEPGYYDVQFIEMRDDRVLHIRWVEHTLVERYPAEIHPLLEVMNFERGFGALQLLLPPGAPTLPYKAEAFSPSDPARPVASATGALPYLVLGLPAGRYDVRVEPLASPGEPTRAGWVLRGVAITTDRLTTKAAASGSAGTR